MITTKKQEQKSTFSVFLVSHKSSEFSIVFDDKKSVSYSGLVLVDDLAKKLGLLDACNATVNLCGKAGGRNPGIKVMTLVESLIVEND